MSAPASAATAPTEAAAATPDAAAAAATAAAPSDEERGLLAYPQWDATQLGLPAGFQLYGYNALKG